MIFVVLFLAGLFLFNVQTWRLHKNGNYDVAAVNFAIMALVWWAIVGSLLGPIQIGETETITVPIGFGFGFTFLLSVLLAVLCVLREWQGAQDASYKLIIVLTWLLPISLFWRITDIVYALPPQ